jgi:hypothetical protein
VGAAAQVRPGVAHVDGPALRAVKSTIGRIWKAFDLQPHRSEDFKLANDPLFVGEKVYDIVGLYLDPREAAVVLCVDKKYQIQALARRQSAFPMMPGMPEKRTHDYVRRGTTSLFAAFEIDDGNVITALRRRHRAIEFRKFLATTDAQVPAHVDIHLVCDNYGTHKAPTVQSWLDRHPCFQIHYTPTYSSNGRLRRVSYLAALSSIRADGPSRQFYDRKRSERLIHSQAPSSARPPPRRRPVGPAPRRPRIQPAQPHRGPRDGLTSSLRVFREVETSPRSIYGHRPLVFALISSNAVGRSRATHPISPEEPHVRDIRVHSRLPFPHV